MSSASRTLLITGASSPLGDVVVPRLVAAYEKTYAVVRSDAAASRVRAHGATPVQSDLESRTLPELPATHLLHMAGIRLASQAVRLAQASGVARIVAISSASAVVPQHPNRDWVLAGERMIADSSPMASILRPTMIFGGPRDRSIRRLRRLLQRLPGVPRFTGGEQIMPVFADDVARAIAECFERNLPGTRPVGGAQPVRFGDLVDRIADVDGMRRIPVTIPVPWLSAGASLVGGRTSKGVHALQMLATSRVVPTPQSVGFDYEPTPLGEALLVAIHRYG